MNIHVNIVLPAYMKPHFLQCDCCKHCHTVSCDRGEIGLLHYGHIQFVNEVLTLFCFFCDISYDVAD